MLTLLVTVRERSGWIVPSPRTQKHLKQNTLCVTVQVPCPSKQTSKKGRKRATWSYREWSNSNTVEEDPHRKGVTLSNHSSVPGFLWSQPIT